MNNYYVYEYIRLDNNEVFYVGKGKGNRAYQLKQRNTYFLNIIKSVPYKVEIILDNLPESDAFEAEMSFINYRKSIGQAKANLTNGGEGSSGYKHSDKAKQILSNFNKGKWTGNKNPNFGKKDMTAWNKGLSTPLDVCEKLSTAKLGCKMHTKTRKAINKANSKQVIDIVSGYIWDSAKEAAEVYSIKYTTLISYLKNSRPNKTNLRYI